MRGETSMTSVRQTSLPVSRSSSRMLHLYLAQTTNPTSRFINLPPHLNTRCNHRMNPSHTRLHLITNLDRCTSREGHHIRLKVDTTRADMEGHNQYTVTTFWWRSAIWRWTAAIWRGAGYQEGFQGGYEGTYPGGPPHLHLRDGLRHPVSMADRLRLHLRTANRCHGTRIGEARVGGSSEKH